MGHRIKNIQDDQITASSYMENKKPWNGRLNNPFSSWIPSDTTNVSKHWIQIDFLHSVPIVGILTQGDEEMSRIGKARAHVTSFQIAFRNNETSLKFIKEKGRAKVSKGTFS